MKNLFSTLLISILFLSTTYSQVPSILWEKSFGGSQDEEGNSIVSDSVGNIFVLGYSGSYDYWLLKINPTGNLLSATNFGGFDIDIGHSIIGNFEKGYILCGESGSNLLPSSHGINNFDSYIICLDSLLNIQWQYCYGSGGDERGIKIKQTLDSGYVFVSDVAIGGGSGSVPGFYGQDDWWVTKIDKSGTHIWSRCLGGTGYDVPTSLVALSDGNILVTGANDSFDGDVICSDPNRTCRVVKLDSVGNIIWDRCYGGSTGNEMGYDIVEGENGGFFVAASTSSYDGDVIDHIGGDDIWIIKADSSGNIIWSHCYGGLSEDRPRSISKTSDGGLLVCGKSTSNIAHPFPYDCIVVKLDSLGHQEWLKYLGGSQWDEAHSAIETLDYDFLVTGFTESNDGDVSFNHGRKDLWVVKLSLTVGFPEYLNPHFEFSSKFENDELEIKINSDSNEQINVIVYDLTGRQLKSQQLNCNKGQNQFNIPFQNSNGLYLIRIIDSKGKYIGHSIGFTSN